jgi:hypothetical protein
MINIKTLLYYWYIHDTGWKPIYNFHLLNLRVYKGVFSKAIFILSHDDGINQEYIDKVKTSILEIFPNAEIRYYKNDKQLRESVWFYNEVALKLYEFPDQWYFFAHNKGVDTFYTTEINLKRWIGGMYYMNLSNMEEIEREMNSDETCAIGTFLVRNFKPWTFLKYNWHFSGTYWWFKPSKIKEISDNLKNPIPSNDRYFTEGFLGSLIPDEEKYRKPALMVYNTKWSQHGDGLGWMTKEMREDINKRLGMTEGNLL